MLYASTNRKIAPVTFREAVLSGLAEDGGLFMPVTMPKLPVSFFSSLNSFSFHEIAYEAAHPFLGGEIPDKDLKQIIEDSFDFKVPLVSLENETYSLELFHGPTLAFKDFGARFMARVLSYLNRNADQPLTILVATSGDTGSAVAHGFFGIQGISVVLLYPQGKVSRLQEMQMTTLGGNVTALEVQGTFDDCQKLVKEAFRDHPLRQKRRLSSANSINIARLIPQSFYYFYAMSQLQGSNSACCVFCSERELWKPYRRSVCETDGPSYFLIYCGYKRERYCSGIFRERVVRAQAFRPYDIQCDGCRKSE